jgi:hypothetical protein
MTGGVHGGRRAAIVDFVGAAAVAIAARLGAVLPLAAALAFTFGLPPGLQAADPPSRGHPAPTVSPGSRVAANGGTSTTSARNQALRSIPWTSLSEPHRRDVQYVVQNASIYRRLPTRVIDCDPDLFTFLLRHPDVVVDVWRLMGISRVSLERTSAEAFSGSDGAGTTGQVCYVFADWGADASNLAVVYAEGAYDGKPFVTPLRAQTVLLLQSVTVQDANGRHHVSVRIDSFVHIDQVGVELLAKTVQPWINRMADQNFVETVRFIGTFSRTAERNPQGMERLAARLRGIDEPTRRELVKLCYRTSERYAHRDESPWIKPLVLAQQAGPPAGHAR